MADGCTSHIVLYNAFPDVNGDGEANQKEHAHTGMVVCVHLRFISWFDLYLDIICMNIRMIAQWHCMLACDTEPTHICVIDDQPDIQTNICICI